MKDTLHSTKQIDERYLRPIVQSLKDMMTRNEIDDVVWVQSKLCYADVLTKKGAPGAEELLEIVRSGKMITQERDD